MSVWAWPALVFAGVLFAVAMSRRTWALAAGFAAYAGLVWLLAQSSAGPARFVAPLIILVTGYRLTAPFYTRPSPALETWLIKYDDRLDVDRRAAAAPGWVRALMETAYAGCYPFMVVAAIPAFRDSAGAFAWHWALVLSAELACYVTLPWLQARPPREMRKNGDRHHFYETRKNGACHHFFRRLNELVLDKLSVRATTIPSGHVAGPVAASLSAWMVAPDYGPWLLAGAALIAVATVIGRYHYAVDAMFGLLVGVAPPALRALWS